MTGRFCDKEENHLIFFTAAIFLMGKAQLLVQKRNSGAEGTQKWKVT